MAKFYLTNAIAYVNAGPHMGHALEAVQGDALARYRRMKGDDVYFLVGTDEHGSKIQQVAKDKGVTPQELADTNAALFVDFHKKVNASNDDFIRTTSERHKKGARALWEKLQAAGKFYDKEYEGKYCTGCEAFILDKDLVEGLCAIHKRAPEVLKEKNIFFKLSDYSEVIKEKVLSGELLIRPESRRNEFLGLLQEGLQDVSFSRPKKTLAWGIEVPGNEDQVMYVWCDALTNYITALGYGVEGSELFKKYWPADVHLIGKDIIRFHCGIWIGMLMAAEIELPKAVYVHGFVTSEGQKMSKSLGNVVDPIELLEKYGADPVRYYLLREIPSDDDGDFSRERFAVVYKDELQNTIGNLIRRVLTIAVKNFETVPQGDGHFDEAIEKAWGHYHERFGSFQIKEALESVLELARLGNVYVDSQKPWELAKTDNVRLEIVLGNLVVLIRTLGKMLQPIVPDASGKILTQVREEKLELGEVLFPPMED